MKVSIVIPVYNEFRTFPQVLARVRAAPLPSGCYREIIVVDDGSTDDSAAVATASGARVLATTAGPRGPAHARNRGAEIANGDIVAFIDADVVVHADTLARMESVLAGEPEVVALFGSYDDDPPTRTTVSLYKNLLHHYVHQRASREASTFWAGCGAVRRTGFLAAGGFDESYTRPSIEDIDLGVRLRQAGHRIRLCPEIQGKHLKRWTLSSLLRTDILARAIPWTRLILRQGRLSSDLNLDWRSRLSALAAWVLLGCALVGLGLGLIGLGRLALGPVLAVVLSAATIGALNADLYAFFFRHAGVRFAVSAAALHVTYLLYSSLVFVSLLVGHTLRARLGHSREQAIK